MALLCDLLRAHRVGYERRRAPSSRARRGRPKEEWVRQVLLLLLATAGLLAGGVAFLAGWGDVAHGVWAVTTVLGLVPAFWWVIDAARHRRLGVDVIAVLALGRHAGGAASTWRARSSR